MCEISTPVGPQAGSANITDNDRPIVSTFPAIPILLPNDLMPKSDFDVSCTTDHEHKVDLLRESETRFRALVNASSDVVYRMSPDWTEMRQLDGRGFLSDTEHPTVRWIDEYIFPADRPDVLSAIDAAVGEKRVFELEHRVRRADGSVGWTFSRAVPVLDTDGEIAEWFGMATDITERKRIEERLAESEIRYRTLFESVQVGFCVFDMLFDDDDRPADYVFVEVNPAFEAQTGLVDAVGRRMSELAPAHEKLWFDLYGKVASTGVPLHIEDFARALGRWYEINAYRVGKPEQRRVAALFNDISERKRAEALVLKMNETLETQVAGRTVELRRFRDIVEATTSPICAFDKQFRLIAFNKAHNTEFRRVNGFDTKLGDVFPDLLIPEQQQKMRALMSRALSGESFTVTEEFGRPEHGQPLWEINYTPLRDQNGEIVGAFHLANDISDRLRAEADLVATQEALRQSQKMEAMGSLTGGVAHDFNNLLTPIVGALDMLQRNGVGGAREQKLIAGAAQSAERARILVQRLLAFARRQPLQSMAIDVAELIRGMVELVSSTTGPQIKVVIDLPDDLPAVKADPNQLEMALLNLSVNARDAMPNGGTLRISTSLETISVGLTLKPGNYIRVSVSDTGIGMDEATANRAIEPFSQRRALAKAQV